MVDFRKKLLGLAGVAVAFAGMANAQQVTCSTLNPVSASYLRAEGQTELLPQLTLTCTSSTSASTMNLTVYLNNAVAITSKVVNSGTSATEAQANGVPGVVTGSSIAFTGIAIPPNASAVITISNIRINATSVPSAAGAPPSQISAQAFVGGTNITGNVIATTVPVAFVLPGLGKVFVSKDTSGTPGVNNSSLGVCSSVSAQNSVPSPTPQFYIQVAEGFANSFKTAGDEGSQVAIAATGSGVSNSVNSGTRLKVVFSNVPAGGLQIYMPTSVVSTNGAVLTLTASETGSLSPISGISGQSNISSLGGSVAQIPVSGTTATAIYESTTDALTTVDNYAIAVYTIAGSNTITAQSAALAVSVSLAPIAPATTVPSFIVGASTTSINTISFVVCQTSLLFPFVTNQAGFETGIAISNTSKDPFGAAKPQSGICTLNYYGTSATNPTATTAPNTNETSGAPYLAGESYAFTLTNALAATTGNPATFQGYIIASCQFQFAHGFAYIVYNFPGTSSDTMGYLALVLGSRGSTSAELTYH